MFVETGKKVIKSFSEVKNKKSAVFAFQKCSYDFLFQEHLTDLDYLDWFLRYEQFCEPWY